jgi:cytochrome b6-f complex iron-sulfur subunit
MERKEFLAQVGIGAAALFLPSCLVTLGSCTSNNVTPVPATVDFTIDISTGVLSVNGGSLVNNGVIVARTTTGDFLAVSAACTHEGTTILFQNNSTSFRCPNHGATFSASGQVTNGPASRALTQYKTALTGTSLRVFT